MGKWVAVFLVGAVFGVPLGVAIGFVVYPYIVQSTPAAEVLPEGERTRVVAEGTFIQADPDDPLHFGSGHVTVYPETVFLEDDFAVAPGPQYHVYLVPKANIRHTDEVKGTMYVDLGPLRAFQGSQRYAIPQGVELHNYPSVVIWCAIFDVLISPADLTFR